jgi:hypothetical protein
LLRDPIFHRVSKAKTILTYKATTCTILPIAVEEEKRALSKGTKVYKLV